MRTISVTFVICVSAGLLALTTAGCTHQRMGEHEQKISTSEVPPKVMDSMKSRFPSGEVRSVAKENEKGTVIYDIEASQQGRNYEMDVKEDGTVVEVEKQIAASDAPASVMQSVRTKYPDATIKEVMEKTMGNEQRPHEYEIVVRTAQGKNREVTVSPDGRITEESGGEK